MSITGALTGYLSLVIGEKKQEISLIERIEFFLYNVI
jgi:hypothetical protein